MSQDLTYIFSFSHEGNAVAVAIHALRHVIKSDGKEGTKRKENEVYALCFTEKKNLTDTGVMNEDSLYSSLALATARFFFWLCQALRVRLPRHDCFFLLSVSHKNIRARACSCSVFCMLQAFYIRNKICFLLDCLFF